MLPSLRSMASLHNLSLQFIFPPLPAVPADPARSYLQVHLSQADQHPCDESLPEADGDEAHLEHPLDGVGRGVPQAMGVQAWLGRKQVREEVAETRKGPKGLSCGARTFACILACGSALLSHPGPSHLPLGEKWKWASMSWGSSTEFTTRLRADMSASVVTRVGVDAPHHGLCPGIASQ